MPRINIQPERLSVVMAEADRIAVMLANHKVDPNEAAKALQFYIYSGRDRELFQRYLNEMAKNPPPRSSQTQESYRSLNQLWQNSGRHLNDEEKMYAWSWAIRLARAQNKKTTNTGKVMMKTRSLR